MRSIVRCMRPRGYTRCWIDGSRTCRSVASPYRTMIVPYERQKQKLEDFPHLKRWFEAIRERPAVIRAYEKGKQINTQPTVDEEARKFLFGQTAATVRR